MEMIRDLYLTDPRVKAQWQAFLTERGIANFNLAETTGLEETIGLYDESNQLVGTGSIAANVIKFVAVCDQGSEQKGARFNRVLSELTSRLAQRGQFHQFVFTKPEYITSFSHVGFNVLGLTETGAILEKGMPDINDYLATIPKFPQAHKIGSIVMNANPFTKGHHYLVAEAAKACDIVYVFVVNADVSLFTTAERTALVKAGTTDLKNVVVVSGQDYLVSFISFPAYFIKNADAVIKYQTQLDASIFKQQLVPALKITDRYLGSEPLSHTTAIYNDSLQAILSPEVKVHIIERLTDTHQVISATTVRQAIKAGNLEALVSLVPATTLAFIKEHLELLQLRIMKGQKINGN